MSLTTDVLDILKKVAVKRGINDPSFKSIHAEGQKHDMAEIHYVMIRDGDSDENIKLVVKKAPDGSSIVRERFPISRIYGNECHFYNKVWPEFQKFQKQFTGEIIFDKIPVCYETDATEDNEKLVLELLYTKDFESINKRDTYDKIHLEYIFKEYAKFHAISLAFKKENAPTYFEESKKFFDYMSALKDIEPVKGSIIKIIQQCVTYLNEEKEEKIILALEKYIEDVIEIFANTVHYKGKNGVIIHGDCWSNNILFKFVGYDENRRIEDVRFCNFHSSKVGTPVYDLSYCFYSGGTEEIYNDLDYYLQVYHESLTEAMKKFNCNADIIYSYEGLKREWKEYSKFGFFMSLLVMRRQLMKPGKDMSLAEIITNPEKTRDIYDETETRKRTLTLMRHFYANDFF